MKTLSNQKGLISLIGIVCGLLVSSQTNAIEIVGGAFDGTDVGSQDTVLATGGVLGSPASEKAYFENETGLSLDFSDATKTEDVPWYFTDVTNVIAFELQQGSGYYVTVQSRPLLTLPESAESFFLGLPCVGSDVDIFHG